MLDSEREREREEENNHTIIEGALNNNNNELSVLAKTKASGGGAILLSGLRILVSVRLVQLVAVLTSHPQRAKGAFGFPSATLKSSLFFFFFFSVPAFPNILSLDQSVSQSTRLDTQ